MTANDPKRTLGGHMRNAIWTIALAIFSAHAIAQYPTRPVRMIVGFPPGGLTDNSARIVAQGLTAELGKPVVVENKAGADSTIAATQVAKAVPDGYTLFYATSGALASGPA